MPWGGPAPDLLRLRSIEGFANVRMLLEEVRRKGDCLMLAWVDEGSPDTFSFAVCEAGYTSTAECMPWFDDLALHSECSKAAFEIRDTCPLALTA